MAKIRWEYDVQRLAWDDLAQIEKHLSERGREGWEIVAVVAAGQNHQVYLKREAQPNF